MDKTLKLLRSKSAKWRGSSVSVCYTPDVSSEDNQDTPRGSGAHQSPPRSAWGGETRPENQMLMVQGHRAATVTSPRQITSPRSSQPRTSETHRVTSPRGGIQRSHSTDRGSQVSRRHSHRQVHPDRAVSPRNGQRSSHCERVVSPRNSSSPSRQTRYVSSPKSGYLSQSSERTAPSRNNKPNGEEEAMDTQLQEYHHHHSATANSEKPKYRMLDYLVNEEHEENKTSTRGRLRKHFSRLKPRVSSASPSLHGSRFRQEKVLPDDYISPHQDPETMVSRHGSSEGIQTRHFNRPHSTTATATGTTRSETFHEQTESVKPTKTGSESLVLNGHHNEYQEMHQHEPQCNSANKSISEQQDSNAPYTHVHNVQVVSNEDTREVSHDKDISKEVAAALKGLTTKPRHVVRRAASAIVTKREAPKLSASANYPNGSKTDDTKNNEPKDEVSRQIKIFADSPEHFKAGPHFQHLYLKRAESIVQKQLQQKAQSLHVKVPQPSEVEVNNYATDTPDSPKVPVLRMTIAKVKNSQNPQPVRTYVQIGKTVKEASFSAGNKGVSGDVQQNTNPKKQTVNHMIVLPSHNRETNDSVNSITHSKVHFPDNVVSEPQQQLVHAKTSILKKSTKQLVHPPPQFNFQSLKHGSTKPKLDSQSDNATNNMENSEDQTQQDLQEPEPTVSKTEQNTAEFEDVKNKDQSKQRQNRGTAIIAVHQEDTPKDTLQKYSSILATKYEVSANPQNNSFSEGSMVESKENSVSGSSSQDEYLSPLSKESEALSLLVDHHKSCESVLSSQDTLDRYQTQESLTKSHNERPNAQVFCRFQVGSAKPTKTVQYRLKANQSQKTKGGIISTSTVLRHLKDEESKVTEPKRRGLQRRRSQKVHVMPPDGQSIRATPRRQSVKKAAEECVDIVEDKQVKVDHSLMVEYLNLVKDNPDEYVTMQNCAPTTRKPVKSIVGMASVFRRGHHEAGAPESLVVQAAYELGSKIPHPVCVRYEKLERQKVEIAAKASVAVTRSVNKRHQVEALELLGQQAEQIEELTPMEKCRAKLEIWLRGLSAGQQIKVKEVALKEMGEEAHSIRKWWLAHKYCKYLRQKTKPDQ